MSANDASTPITPLLISLRKQFADAKTQPKPNVKPQSGVMGKCVCSRAECRAIQKLLKQKGDLWFGTAKLTYSDTNMQAKQYAQHVLETFGLSKDYFPTGKDTQFKVARHHWTRSLVALHDEYPFFWKKPLPTDEDAVAYLYKVLPSSRFPCTNRGYFQTPDQPLERVQEYLKKLYPGPTDITPRDKLSTEDAHQSVSRTPDEWRAIIEFKELEINRLLQEKIEMQTKLKEANVLAEHLKASNLTFRQERNDAVRGAKRQKLMQTQKLSSGNAELYPCTVQTFYDFICISGGLSRISLSSDDWHYKHPKAALHLFGYKTWSECIFDVKQRFPDLVHDRPSMTRRKNGTLELDTLTEFEKCLCMKMYSRTKLSRQRLGLVWGVDDTTITRYKKTWGRVWEDLGFTLPEYTGLKLKKDVVETNSI